jgi:hypothetical protein
LCCVRSDEECIDTIAIGMKMQNLPERDESGLFPELW